MNTKRASRGIQLKAGAPSIADPIPTSPASTDDTNAEATSKADDTSAAAVNVGECLGGVSFCRSESAILGAEQPENFSFADEKVPNNVHDVHHVHQPEPESEPESESEPAAACDLGLPGVASDPRAEVVKQAAEKLGEIISRCGEEPALLASDDFIEAARLVREYAPGEWFRVRVALKENKPSGIPLGDIDRVTRPASEEHRDTTTADELVELVRERAELWHAEDGTCYATLNEQPRKTLRLDTKAFSEWLSYAYYRHTARDSDEAPGSAASDVAIRTARTVLNGIATNEGEERDACLRTARHGDAYYLDLGDDAWSAVEITATGWRIIDAPPVRFWRSSTMRPLPQPVAGGDLSELWSFANIPEAARPLVEAVMLESWRPETPFPLLELIGQHGSAKSSTQSRLRCCIDPNAINLRAAPKSTEDLYVSAGVNWCCSLNNLSHLSANLQDALCSLATGGGFAGRTLYTNSDETVIDAKRPVMLNGIVPLVTAQDLTDRVVHIELPTIETYRSETELEAEFSAAWPRIFGALLDRFSATLAVLPRVQLKRPPRMADFARLGEAMMRAQGSPEGKFLTLYEANRRDSVARNLEASPVAMAVRALVEDPHNGAVNGSGEVFEGTMKKLLRLLEDNYRDQQEAWPKSPRGLGDALRRQRPALAQIGIAISISKPGKEGVNVVIRRVGEHGERRERCSEDIRYQEKNFPGDSVEAFV